MQKTKQKRLRATSAALHPGFRSLEAPDSLPGGSSNSVVFLMLAAGRFASRSSSQARGSIRGGRCFSGVGRKKFAFLSFCLKSIFILLFIPCVNESLFFSLLRLLPPGFRMYGQASGRIRRRSGCGGSRYAGCFFRKNRRPRYRDLSTARVRIGVYRHASGRVQRHGDTHANPDGYLPAGCESNRRAGGESYARAALVRPGMALAGVEKREMGASGNEKAGCFLAIRRFPGG